MNVSVRAKVRMMQSRLAKGRAVVEDAGSFPVGERKAAPKPLVNGFVFAFAVMCVFVVVVVVVVVILIVVPGVVGMRLLESRPAPPSVLHCAHFQ